MSDIKILGICGSMRKDSYNSFALKAAQALVPAGAQLELIDLLGIPIFNQDDELAPPEAVLEFKRRILAGEISTYSMEKRYLRKDGDIVWANLNVALVHEADGRYRVRIVVPLGDKP